MAWRSNFDFRTGYIHALAKKQLLRRLVALRTNKGVRGALARGARVVPDADGTARLIVRRHDVGLLQQGRRIFRIERRAVLVNLDAPGHVVMHVAHIKEVSARLQSPIFVGVLPLVAHIVGDRERHQVARARLQSAAVLVGVGVLTGVLLLVAALALIGLILIAALLTSVLLITTLTGVLLLISSFPLVASLASVLFLVAFLLVSFLLALVTAFPFVLVLALPGRVQPRLPRDDERVLVGVLVYLITVQVERGQIVLVVVRLGTCVTTARRRNGAGLSSTRRTG